MLARLRIAALVGLLLVTVACMSGPTERRSDEELLAIGTAELTAVAFPVEWQLTGRTAERREGELAWFWDFTVPGTHDDAEYQLRDVFRAAGWQRGRDCADRDRICYTFDKGGLHVFPSVTNSVCPDGSHACVSVSIWMYRNSSKPL